MTMSRRGRGIWPLLWLPSLLLYYWGLWHSLGPIGFILSPCQLVDDIHGKARYWQDLRSPQRLFVKVLWLRIGVGWQPPDYPGISIDWMLVEILGELWPFSDQQRLLLLLCQRPPYWVLEGISC
jgi:hypothetical protein